MWALEQTLLASVVLHLSLQIVGSTHPTLVASPKIESKLYSAFTSQEGPVNVIVSFSKDTSSVIDTFELTSHSLNRNQKLWTLKDSLEGFSEANQKSVREALTEANVNFRVLWITNQISIKGVTPEAINKLTGFEEVASILEDVTIALENPTSNASPSLKQSDQHEWGILRIEGDKAQAALAAIEVSDVVVGVVDSGVQGTHEALNASYIGEYGWLDVMKGEKEPYDDLGHGTHCAGTIVGTKGIGVHPTAKWMACKACLYDCSLSDFILCGQFMMCPFLPDGTFNCSKAPQVVSNSWGIPGSYAEVIRAYHAVGIIPVFAIGNFLPWEVRLCETTSNPGDSKYVIGVGATASDESIASFSKLGPSLFPGEDVKPDLVAPGVDVRSASISSDSDYIEMSGTSMACPHVSGVVAMLLSVKPDLSFEEVRRYLLNGTETEDLVPSGTSCGGISDTEFPNHVFGYGRLNAQKSLSLLLRDMDEEKTTTSSTRPTLPEPESAKSSKVNTVVVAIVSSVAAVLVVISCVAAFYWRKKFLQVSTKGV